MFRSAVFASVAMIASLASPALAQTDAGAPDVCAATSFRIYFEHGSDALTPMAMETLNAAARNVAGCDYAELHVAAQSGAHARRGDAVLAALNGRSWDVARVEPWAMTHVTYSSAPEFVEVSMTPYRMAVPVEPTTTTGDVGV